MPNSSYFSDTATDNHILDEDGYPVDEIPRLTETDYFYYEEKIVEHMPKKKPLRDPKSTLGKVKDLFKPPVVRAHERLPKREGKFYHVNKQGEIIQTTVRRAYIKPGLNAFGGNFKEAIK